MIISKTCLEVINQILETREENDPTQYYSDVSKYAQKTAQNRTANHETALLPTIIVFDPLKQYPNAPILRCPHCIQDGDYSSLLLVTNCWHKGQGNSRYPRTIWDQSWYCAVVGRQYKCTRAGHPIVSYHNGILEALKSYNIPFIFSHRSGMTRTTFDLIVRLVAEGTSFTGVQSIMSGWLMDSYLQRKKKSTCKFPQINEVFKSMSPCQDLIRQCFVDTYERNIVAYQQELDKIPHQSLYCDDTFECAVNIGTMEDKKWTKLCNGVLIITNETGHVKGYEFVKQKTFENFRDKLVSVASTQTATTFIFTNKCCDWRADIQQLLPGINVKYDVNQAIQRLVATLPENHSLTSKASKEIEMIFRGNADTGQVRMDVTPPAEIILWNLSKFLIKWNEIDDSNGQLLFPNFASEVQELQEHIKAGCLSDIPACPGLVRLETLHNQLRLMIHTHRINPQTAHALFSHTFYVYNCKLNGERIVPPIWSLDNSEVLDCLETNVDSTLALPPEVLFSEKDLGYQSVKQDLSGEEQEHSGTLIGPRTLSLAIMLHKLDSRVTKEARGRLQLYRGLSSLPTKHCNLNEYFKMCKQNPPLTTVDFNAIMHKLGLKVIESARNSQSFLLSLSSIILLHLQCGKFQKEHVQYFSSIKIQSDSKLDYVVSVIKKILYHEFKGARRPKYLSFIDEKCYDTEMYAFLHNDYVAASINDALPLAAAHAVVLPIVLIPNTYCTPMYPILPDESAIIDELIFLTYDSSDGTFNALMVDDDSHPVLAADSGRNVCFCGERSKNEKDRCSNSVRCSCKDKGISCSQRCRCKGCINNKPEQKFKYDHTQPRRKRKLQQAVPTDVEEKGKPYVDFFAVLVGSPDSSNLNTALYFLLEASLFIFVQEFVVTLDEHEPDLLAEKLHERTQKLCGEFSSTCSEDEFALNSLRSVSLVSIHDWIVARKQRVILDAGLKEKCLLRKLAV